MNDKQPRTELKSPADTSLVCGSEEEAFNSMTDALCLSPVCNPEESLPVSGSGSCVDKKNRKSHSVFVLSKEGRPLTPTTPARAKKLLKDHVAKPVWSKFNTFGIQMLVETRKETPPCVLGVDNGTKFEGYSVVCGEENNLNIKLDLPDKKQIVRKLEKRRTLRRARRFRKTRRRSQRFDNRSRRDFLAPSQAVIVNSRLKVMHELFRIYPIKFVGFEDVGFNHAKNRWGANFSTVEIGKARLRAFFADQHAQVHEFKGHETQELRKKYGYRKTRDKRADNFTAHCSDSLALAVEVGPGYWIEPGSMIVVDDTYRPVRRQLHDTQPTKGGVRALYSKGTVFGYRKGLLIGTFTGRTGRLCGEYKGGFRYYDLAGKRQSVKKLSFACGHFITREIATSLPLREAKANEISPAF